MPHTPSLPNTVTEVVEAALATEPGLAGCHAYREAFINAIAAEPPPFGTSRYADLYRGASSDPRWMAVSLLTNAEREGDGSGRLWSLATFAQDENEKHQLKLYMEIGRASCRERV